jgi:WD40 repeat protein
MPRTRDVALLLPIVCLVSLTSVVAQPSDGVSALAVSHGRSLAAVGRQDGRVEVWDLVTGARKTTLREHRNAVHTLAFAADDALLISADESGTLRGRPGAAVHVWMIATGKKVRTITSDEIHLPALALSPVTRQLAVARGSIDIFDLDTGQQVRSIDLVESVASLAFSHAGDLLVVGTSKTVRVFDVASGGETAALNGHDDTVNSVAWVGAGTIATGSTDGTVRLWDLERKRQIRSFRPGSRLVRSVVAAGTLLATVHLVEVPVRSGGLTLEQEQWTAALWSTEGRRLQFRPPSATDIDVAALAGDGSLIVTGRDNGAIEVWNTVDGSRIRQLGEAVPDARAASRATPSASVPSASGEPRVLRVDRSRGLLRPLRIHFSGDGRFLVSDSADRGAVWDLLVGRRVAVYEGGYGSAISAAGDRLAASRGISVTVHTLGDPTATRRLEIAEFITALAFSPRGDQLALGSRAGNVTFWDMAGGPATTIRAHTQPITQLAYTTDGTSLVVTAARAVAVCRLGGGSDSCATWPIPERGTVSSDGRLVAAGVGTSELWSTEQGRHVTNAPFGAPLAIDGNRAASSDAEGKVTIWSTTHAMPQLVIPAANESVHAAAFRPRHDTIALTDDEHGSVRLYDTLSGRELVSLLSINEDDWLAVAPDGRHDGTDTAVTALETSDGGSPPKALRSSGLLVAALDGTLPAADTGILLQGTRPAPPHLAVEFVAEPAEAPHIRVTLSKGEHPVDELRLEQNGVTIARERLNPSVAMGGLTRSFAVRPTPGRNEYRVVASSVIVDVYATTAATVSPPPDVPRVIPQVGHRNPIQSLTLGLPLVATASGSSVLLWDLAMGRQVRSLYAPGVNRVRDLVFDRTRERLAAATDVGIVVWEVASGSVVRVLRTESLEEATAVVFAGELLLATAGRDLIAWKTADWQPWERMRGHDRPVTSMAVDAGGTTLLTGSIDGTAHLWRIGDRIARLRTMRHGAHVDAVAISADGTTLASRGRDSCVRIWSAADGTSRGELRTNSDDGLTFSPSGSLLLASGNGGLRVWDVASGRELWTRPNISEASSFTPDGETIVAGLRESGSMALFDARTGSDIRRIFSRSSYLTSLAFGPRTNELVTFGDGVHSWDLAAARLASRGAADRPFPPGLQVSDDWKRFGAEGQVITFSNGTAASTPIQMPECTPLSCAFALSGDGTRVAALGNDQVTIADAANGRVLTRLQVTPPPRNRTAGLFEKSMAAMGIAPPTFNVSSRIASPGHIALSTDGILVATVRIESGAADIHVWRSGTAQPVASILTPSAFISALRFDRRGNVLAHGDTAGTLFLWDIEGGNLLHAIPAHEGRIQAIAFNEDGTRVATVADDGAARLWRTDTGAAIVTLIPTTNEGFVVVSPDGRYSASRSAVDAVAFRIGRSVAPFEQFDAILNRPDVVAEAIGLADVQLLQAYTSAVKARLRRLGLPADAVPPPMDRVPQLKIHSAVPLATATPHLDIAVAASATAAPLRRLEVLVNDVPIGTRAGVPLRGSSAEVTVSVVLSPGRNKIQIFAVDELGLGSLSSTHYVTYTAPSAAPQLYVLAIGISRYLQEVANLDYAAKDAKDFASFIGEQLTGARIHVLTDAEATRSGILAARKFLEQARVDDQVIVFVAGHGVLDGEGTYYLAPHDMDFERPSLHGVSFEDLEALLDGLTVRRKLLLMDTCHAGELDDPATALAPATPLAPSVAARATRTLGGLRRPARQSTALLEELFAELRRGNGAVVITAAGGAQFAYEGVDGSPNGLFTSQLLDGLRGTADTNRDLAVSVGELRDFVVQRVSELTGGRQRPTARRDVLEFDFPVLPPRAKRDAQR